MGSFDRFIGKVTCQSCGDNFNADIQTKEYGCTNREFTGFDPIPGSGDVTGIVDSQSVACPSCGEEVEVAVQLVYGILHPLGEPPIDTFDTFQVVRFLADAARKNNEKFERERDLSDGVRTLLMAYDLLHEEDIDERSVDLIPLWAAENDVPVVTEKDTMEDVWGMIWEHLGDFQEFI